MKYIFLDIDGTLHSTKINDIPKSALLAIKRAKENGNKIFLCTGRALAVSKLFLDFDVDGFIFSAGSLVYIDGKKVFEKTMNRETLKYLMDMADKLEVGICIEGYEKAYYDDRGYQSLIKYFSKGRSIEETEKIMLDNCYYPMKCYDYKDPVSKAIIYGNSFEHIYKFKDILPDSLKGVLAFADEEQSNFGLEITDKYINKATGIQHVLNQYSNVTFNDVVAIGDSANDIDMIKAASIGIAMGNAAISLKEVADFISSDILDDGVYKAFEYYGLI